MLSELRAWGDRLRSSLFFIPMLCVIGGVILGEAMLGVDALVTGISPRLTATVDSARTVLTTVAGATLTFAGIAFSVSLLLISLASSQYSPRVVHGMFRDPFNKRVMGLVIGTFTYCLVVLRAVRTAVEGPVTRSSRVSRSCSRLYWESPRSWQSSPSSTMRHTPWTSPTFFVA